MRNRAVPSGAACPEDKAGNNQKDEWCGEFRWFEGAPAEFTTRG